jgi:hypothetical protein
VFALTNRSPNTLTITGCNHEWHRRAAFSMIALPETIAAHSVSNFSVVFQPDSAGSYEASSWWPRCGEFHAECFRIRGGTLHEMPARTSAGNTLTITNGYFGTITNVTVGGVSAAIQDSGRSWVRITVPALGTTGAKDIVIQTSDHGDQVLSGVYYGGPRYPAVPVYYAVGQNTNDHMTGTPTLTIHREVPDVLGGADGREHGRVAIA